MKTPLVGSVLLVFSMIAFVGCQTAAPAKPLVAKPVTGLADEHLLGKQLKVVGSGAGFDTVELQADRRFVATNQKGEPTEGNWQRRDDQVLLLAKPIANLRTYSKCRLKEVNGHLCLYYESQGQFVEKRTIPDDAELIRRAQEAQGAVETAHFHGN